MAERQPNEEHGSTPPEKRDDRESASWHKMAGIGVEFIAAVGVFAALGWWLDGKFATSPWLVIAGCGLGFTVGLYQMVKAADRMMK